MVFSRRMKRKYLDRIAILDSLGKRIVDFVPHGLEARSMDFRNNELWMLEKPDYETIGCNLKIFKMGLKVN